MFFLPRLIISNSSLMYSIVFIVWHVQIVQSTTLLIQILLFYYKPLLDEAEICSWQNSSVYNTSDGHITNQITVRNHKYLTKRFKSLCQITRDVTKFEFDDVRISATSGVFDICRILWSFSVDANSQKISHSSLRMATGAACAQLVLGRSWYFNLLQLTN